MRISLVAIGDELLKGATINTNSGFIGQELLAIGIYPDRCLTIRDDGKSIKEALDFLLPDSDIIITSGGLGPTADDISRDMVAEYLNLGMHEDAEVKEKLLERWHRLKGEDKIPENNLCQTMVPDGAEVIDNPVGTAPGLFIPVPGEDKKYVIMLPGPPSELNPMVTGFLVPRVRELLDTVLHSSVIYVAGIAESELEQRMQPLIRGIDSLSVAYCAAPEAVRVFLTSEDEALIRQKTVEVKELFGKYVLTDGSESLAEDVSKLLKEQNLRIATAESCTGGMIASIITKLAGSSQIFPGSIISYSNEIKHQLLKVKDETLEKYGAVSAECVEEMLEGIKINFGTETGIAVSGIAGPDGGTKEKPVGTVFIGIYLNGKRRIETFRFPGNRQSVRKRTVAKALQILRLMLLDE
jgi:nicotinamide-nucleotide amidase